MKRLSVKGFSDRIELAFAQKVSLSDAKEELSLLSEKEKSFFTKDKIRISYCGTEFNYDEELEFFKAVKKMFGKKISFVKQHKLTKEQIYYSLSAEETVCKVIKRSLRSGEDIYSDGDILVMGDVNAGASLFANANITVLGALRGRASVKKGGRVYATYMTPSQIRIGKLCSYNKKPKNIGAAVAVAENGEIILKCL